ncbi:MAG TPA: hypothetical protein VM145_05780 [Sphingomicrobium sp.]|nr:hypothetical protein [Sphingomicrobium sp.]
MDCLGRGQDARCRERPGAQSRKPARAEGIGIHDAIRGQRLGGKAIGGLIVQSIVDPLGPELLAVKGPVLDLLNPAGAPVDACLLAVDLTVLDRLDAINAGLLTLNAGWTFCANLLAFDASGTLGANLLPLDPSGTFCANLLALDASRTLGANLLALGASRTLGANLLAFGAGRTLGTNLLALCAGGPFGARLRSLFTGLARGSTVGFIAVRSGAGLGRDRQCGDAGGEKYPGHHKISFLTALTTHSPHRSHGLPFPSAFYRTQVNPKCLSCSDT